MGLKFYRVLILSTSKIISFDPLSGIADYCDLSISSTSCLTLILLSLKNVILRQFPDFNVCETRTKSLELKN